jgi:hypothetical protein
MAVLRRYALVPLTDEERAAVGAGRVRRYALARIAVSPRSALGVDRHERLERVAARDRRADDQRGSDGAMMR